MNYTIRPIGPEDAEGAAALRRMPGVFENTLGLPSYRTADSTFWSNLARESQQEFQRSGTEGKCIEARELIIALPEIYTQYEPQQVLTDFT